MNILNIFELPPPIDRYCWCSKVKEMHPLVLKKNIPRALIFKKSHVVHTESIIFGSIHLNSNLNSFFQSLVVSKWLFLTHWKTNIRTIQNPTKIDRSAVKRTPSNQGIGVQPPPTAKRLLNPFFPFRNPPQIRPKVMGGYPWLAVSLWDWFVFVAFFWSSFSMVSLP